MTGTRADDVHLVTNRLSRDMSHRGLIISLHYSPVIEYSPTEQFKAIIRDLCLLCINSSAIQLLHLATEQSHASSTARRAGPL